jgi:exodeoxyribonuclease-3
MRIISWNINGIKNAYKKGHLKELLESVIPDIICLQEVRCSDPPDIPGYKFSAFSCAERKGYSGTCVAVRNKEPIGVYRGFQVPGFKTELVDTEGRITIAEFDTFYIISVYVPNSKPDLSRLEWRTSIWDAEFRRLVMHLEFKRDKKPVIVCGDYNVAREEIDIHNAKGKAKTHGFTAEERAAFEALIADAELVDTFRAKNGGHIRKYSWWSNFAKSRERNAGWRIDYMLVSESIASKVKKSDILTDVMGSDHAPCLLEIDI